MQSVTLPFLKSFPLFPPCHCFILLFILTLQHSLLVSFYSLVFFYSLCRCWWSPRLSPDNFSQFCLHSLVSCAYLAKFLKTLCVPDTVLSFFGMRIRMMGPCPSLACGLVKERVHKTSRYHTVWYALYKEIQKSEEKVINSACWCRINFMKEVAISQDSQIHSSSPDLPLISWAPHWSFIWLASLHWYVLQIQQTEDFQN